MTAKISKTEATELIKKALVKFSRKDLSKVFANSEELKKKFTIMELANFAEDFKLLLSLIKDYVNGSYKVSWKTIAAVGFTLLYILNPADIIPDLIPVLGYFDDAAIIAACLAIIEKDLLKYKECKSRQLQ